MIEDVDFDVDIDGNGNPVATLVFDGDFVDECSRYMNDEETTRLYLRIDRAQAEKLVDIISPYLEP